MTDRVPDAGIDLDKRNEHESALRHPWMWDGKCLTVHDAIIVEQDVDIERTRTKADATCCASVVTFDPLADRQQILRRSSRLDTDNLVQKVRLIEETDRLGLIDRGPGNDMHSLLLKLLASPAKLIDSIAQIGA